MTAAEALEALAALQRRAEAALAAGDAAAGEEVLLGAIWMKVEPETPTSRALGQAFGRLATTLAELVRPEAAVGGLNRAAHAFQHAPDARFVDFVVTLNNLARAHERAGDSAQVGATITQIVRLASAWTGEVEGSAALVFMHFTDWCRRSRQFAPMLVLQAQVLRYMLTNPQVADDVRAPWLRRHAELLREADASDTLRADLDRAEAALRARSDAPLSLGVCRFERSQQLAADGDWAGAAALIDQALASPGLPAAEQTALLTLAARAWFKAGDFGHAAERSRRALRRRVGLTA